LHAFDWCGTKIVPLDIGLPGLDGFEVAKRMRKQPGLQNVVLVAHDRAWPGDGPAAFAGSGVRLSFGQARPFRAGAENLGKRLGEGDMMPSNVPVTRSRPTRTGNTLASDDVVSVGGLEFAKANGENACGGDRDR
jgi:hypothetical protein